MDDMPILPTIDTRAGFGDVPLGDVLLGDVLLGDVLLGDVLLGDVLWRRLAASA
jgi:hypothetical protein